MKLGDLLDEGLILVGFRAKDKWEALGKLVDALVARGRLRPDERVPVYDALVARESLASTGMEYGVAIPHASVDSAEEALGAFGIAPEGIPFESADDQPARLIMLLVIPRKSLQKHIRTLAGIARLLNYPEMREALLRARSPLEALQIIRAEEAKDSA